MTALVAGSNTKVGFTRFAGSVDDATHDGYLQRNFALAKGLHRPIRDINDINLSATTAWARNEIDVLSFAQTKSFE